MMVKKLSVAELKAHLAEALREVEAGDRIAVERRGKTVAVLVPPNEESLAVGAWLQEIYGIMVDVGDFESIMKKTLKSRPRAHPRPVRLED